MGQLRYPELSGSLLDQPREDFWDISGDLQMPTDEWELEGGITPIRK